MFDVKEQVIVAYVVWFKQIILLFAINKNCDIGIAIYMTEFFEIKLEVTKVAIKSTVAPT